MRYKMIGSFQKAYSSFASIVAANIPTIPQIDPNANEKITFKTAVTNVTHFVS